MSTTLETAPRATVFVDRLRVVLIAQVVLHHVALTYGSFPLWYYHEPTMRGPGLPAGSAWPLDLLLLLNQTYFMGLFFLLSACFVPASLERKGGARFLLDRLRRLGLPMLAGYFLIVPLAKIPKYLWLDEREPVPFGAFYLDELEMGPFWFLATLLAFTLAYAGFRALRGQAPPPVSSAPRARTIVGFGAVLAATGVLWRIWEPIERVPVLEVAAPAYLPQYVCMFVAGLAVHRRGWLTALPASAAGWGFGAALAGTLLLLPVIVVTMEATGEPPLLQHLAHGLFDGVFCTGMAVGLLSMFRHRFAGAPRTAFLTSNAFAVYVIHAPVLVAVSVALANLRVDPVAKFAVVSVVALPACWGLAHLLRKALPRRGNRP